MSQPSFDPCKQWLGIDAVDLGDPRRVLGLAPHEIKSQAIIRAATEKLSILQGVSPGAFAMAHAALLRRVAEARDALLAEAEAATAPRFSMPPPPSSMSPAAPMSPAMPPAPGTQPLPMTVPASAGFSRPPARAQQPVPVDTGNTSPAMAMPMPTAPQSKKAFGSALAMPLVAVLGIIVGVLGYRAFDSRQQADSGGREIVLADADRETDRVSDPTTEADRSPEAQKPGDHESAPDNTSAPAEDGSTNQEAVTEVSDEQRPPTPAAEDAPPVSPPRGEPEAEPAADSSTPTEVDPSKADPFGQNPREPDPFGPNPTEPDPFGSSPAASDPFGPSPNQTESVETEPAPAEPVEPSTKASPPPPDTRKIEALLAKSFASIQQQAFDDARKTLAAAKELADDDATRRRVDSFFELAEYSEEFFAYRQKALDAVRPGIEYKIPSTNGSRLIAIVENTPQELIYREAGKNNRWPRAKIPAAVLTHILREWFDDRPSNRLFIGAYFASKPEPDIAKARAEWGTAQAGGVDVSRLMPLLDDPVIVEATK